ncbi:2'-5' RNA ligase family protein [Streptomyces sp. NPDC091292]|uniref:2'-5' RNA ligase family protein n=1 Tax=Streptomyces sp. NPDC091292 TaxID=3365991 RepID=UPI0038254B7B
MSSAATPEMPGEPGEPATSEAPGRSGKPAPTGTTAVVITLAEADVLLDAARQVNASLVRPGLPAHVTLRYPFLPAAELSAATDRAVRDFAAATPAREVELTEVTTAQGFVAVAVPALQPVADAFGELWPGMAPYSGRFGPHPPTHVTVATGSTDEETLTVATRLRPLLPLTARAGALHLAVREDEGWRIRLTARFRSPRDAAFGRGPG